MATVVVGAEEKEFLVHQALICYYSGYFRGAFSGSFQEATTRIVRIKDTSIVVFEAFVTWLYSGRLFNHDTNAPPKEYIHRLLIEIWLFGDRILCPVLQNDVIDLMIANLSVDGLVHARCIEICYSRTLDGSPLRKYVVDQLALSHSNKALTEWAKWSRQFGLVYPQEFFLDLLQRRSEVGFRVLTRREFSQIHRCSYHEHYDPNWVFEAQEQV